MSKNKSSKKEQQPLKPLHQEEDDNLPNLGDIEEAVEDYITPNEKYILETDIDNRVLENNETLNSDIEQDDDIPESPEAEKDTSTDATHSVLIDEQKKDENQNDTTLLSDSEDKVIIEEEIPETGTTDYIFSSNENKKNEIEESDDSTGFVFGSVNDKPNASSSEKLTPTKEEKTTKHKKDDSIYSMFKEKKAFKSSKNFKLGIVGSKGVGKSYLFHAMVYRLQNSANAGALSYFLKDSRITISGTVDRETNAEVIPFTDFIESYIDWRRLAPTKEGTQKWYRLSIPYKSGLFGRGKRSLDVEFFDGAGEIYSAGDSTSKKYWEQNFKDTSVIVFCLPLWVAFPNQKNKNNKARRDILNGFENVINAYHDLRNSENIKIATKSILALTMSDDVENTSLESDLVESWLKPYMLEDPSAEPDLNYFKDMNSGGAVNRYLANARKVSNLLNKRFKTSGDVLVSNIPSSMNFKAGAPWIIPVSAIRGDFLKEIEEIDEQYPEERPEELIIPDHNPAHVELPLLVALCEHTNALM